MRLDAYTFSVHDPRAFTDDEITEAVALRNVLDAEVTPDDLPTPVEQVLAAHRATPARMRRWSFRARDTDGRLVGAAGTSIDPEHDDNPDLLFVNVSVHPEHRRRGLGTRLLGELVELARTEGRSRLLSSTVDVVAGAEDFARAAGAEPKLPQHVNRLVFDDIDRDMLERWVADGPVRAADYELMGWDGPTPEEHLTAFADLVLVMNTAPRDDLDVNDFTLTPELLRESEERTAATGVEVWTLVARRKDDGAFAGFHDVGWNPSNPKVMWVDSTGVRPEHRGHAIGKWLKAAMQLRILDERPEVREIRTGNADSNDAMLGINRTMGYEPFFAATAWEVAVDVVASRLAQRA